MTGSAVATLDFDAADLLDLLSPNDPGDSEAFQSNSHDDSCPFDSPSETSQANPGGNAAERDVGITGDMPSETTNSVTAGDLDTRAHAEIVPGDENSKPLSLADSPQNAEISATASPSATGGDVGTGPDGVAISENLISVDGISSAENISGEKDASACVDQKDATKLSEIKQDAKSAAGIENKKIETAEKCPRRNASPVAFTEAERAAWKKIGNLETQIEGQGKIVLEQTVTVALLEAKVKSARKNLKDATEDLIDLQGKLVDAKQDQQEISEKDYREWRERMDRGDFGEGRTAAPGSASSPSLVDVGSPAAVSPAAVPRPTVGEMVDGVAGTNLVDSPLPGAATSPTTRTVIDPDPALTTDIWVLKSKMYGGGATNAQIEKLNGEDVRTIAGLEEYIRNGMLVPGKVKGLGQSAVDKISDALMAWRGVKGNGIPEPREEVIEVEIEGNELAKWLGDQMSASNGTAPAIVDQKTLSNELGSVENVEKTGGTNTGDQRPVDSPPLADVLAPAVTASPAPAPAPAAPIPIDPIEADIQAAYVAGCEAGVADKPVTDNPHGKGSQLWNSWDAGYQETVNA